MTKKEAIEMFQQVTKDMQNGVKISREAEALIYFALEVPSAYDLSAEGARDEAEWEFQNNPMQPQARRACERLAMVLEKDAEKARKELFEPTGLPGISLIAEQP